MSSIEGKIESVFTITSMSESMSIVICMNNVVHNILMQLPIHDMISCSLVNRIWRRVDAVLYLDYMNVLRKFYLEIENMCGDDHQSYDLTARMELYSTAKLGNNVVYRAKMDILLMYVIVTKFDKMYHFKARAWFRAAEYSTDNPGLGFLRTSSPHISLYRGHRRVIERGNDIVVGCMRCDIHMASVLTECQHSGVNIANIFDFVNSPSPFVQPIAAARYDMMFKSNILNVGSRVCKCGPT